MKRLIILAAAVAVVAAACAERGPHVVGAAPTGPSPSIAPSEIAVTATATASGPVEVPSVSFQLWFTRNDHLFEIPWVVPETKAVGTASLEALLGGPPNPSVAEGVGTQIPPGTTLLGLSISNDLATVNLSPQFLSGGSAVSEWTRLGQVVFTIGQFPTVKRVAIQLDGQPIKPFDGAGDVGFGVFGLSASIGLTATAPFDPHAVATTARLTTMSAMRRFIFVLLLGRCAPHGRFAPKPGLHRRVTVRSRAVAG